MAWVTKTALSSIADASAAALVRSANTQTHVALSDFIGDAIAGEVVAGGTVDVVEGAQWGAEVDISGGLATFKFTVPPGGEAWSKGALASGTTMAAAAKGTYQITSASVATGLGLPGRVGSLKVEESSSTRKTALFETGDIDAANPLEIWAAATDAAGVWQPWRLVYSPLVTPDAAVSFDTDGVPYWNPTTGDMRIFWDVDGVPYFSRSERPAPLIDTDDVPALVQN